MRILIATPLYPPDDGGPATRAKTLEDALPKEGISVEVVSFSHFRYLPKGISHFAYLVSLLRKMRSCDLIYALDPVSVGLPAFITAKLCRKPLVLCIVGDYAWEQGAQRFGVKENLDEFTKKFAEGKRYLAQVHMLRFVERMVAHGARKIIVPSQYLNHIVGQWGVDSKKIVVIYNAFKSDLPSETKDELRKSFAMVHPTVISVGRFVPWKGFKVLMDVVSEVRKNVPDVVLQIAGSGNDAEYRTYAKEKGYDFVHFLGLLDHAMLMKRIKAADCFALNTGYEGLSHVLLETMALGTPIVTTDVGGNPELFSAARKRWLAHYNETDHLRSLIELALVDKEGAKKDAEEAAVFVSSFTEDRMIKETITVFKEAI